VVKARPEMLIVSFARSKDMAKGRRIEIEYLNGFVVREGKQVGIAARANKWLLISSKRSSARRAL
jgi:ketopantoate reductase